ncbi:MAG TPA: hypothetical protein PLE61_04305 [Vicinamibacterales bacterium]|nr:hypothetical protein [Vicinamibacterales bacterium]HPW20017.1 hypothetical protein [Vicinamibacterales bacterium]
MGPASAESGSLRCALCPVSVGFTRPRGVTGAAPFRKVLDDSGPCALTLRL